MKKTLYAVIVLGVFLAAAVGYFLTTASGQDTLFKRAAGAVFNAEAPEINGMRVVVCGSASPLGNDPDRAQACIAVITPEHFFIFDVGARSPLRLAQARLPMARLNGVFLTHFHSDHISGLADVNLASWVQGRSERLQVYGPAGVERVIAGFNMAYSLDRGYRTAHHGQQLLPARTGPMQAQSFSNDGVVWQDDKLTVTAFLVEHPPIQPAVGYRVDYAGRSVVISGDCNASKNLFAFAKGADLLLHDALARSLLDPMIQAASAANVPMLPTIMRDVIDYHADTRTLPEQAKAAGIKQLALYHMVPVPTNALTERMFLRDMPADVILTADLQTFDLPAASEEIIIHGP
ncbi:MAG: MBL fold metallo-hydrolase [Pseudomonadota bacterium]